MLRRKTFFEIVFLREHTRVEENIEAIRQKRLYDNSDSDDENEEFSEFENTGFTSDLQKLARQDFIFISEMMVMENVVIPLLLAHGMNFSSTLLPQLLKLLTAMLLPVPFYSMERPRQMDFVCRLMERCGTDEFFYAFDSVGSPSSRKTLTRCHTKGRCGLAGGCFENGYTFLYWTKRGHVKCYWCFCSKSWY
ncbi:hypothetical protein C3747_333g19 [Trypanosoma cruzi]|uniref:Uncharacterized protein n=1 Tax=Trypanosoma cruzi TaxID=5693 RepID=A0A2V2V8C5_TRYCR|nr:hypothetical protein C3747_333g19 [Trypanosoma cruzi]